MRITRVPIEQRLWARVDVREEDECWEWMGSRNRAGYGQIGTTRRGRKHRTFLAHRVAFASVVGEIPEGMNVCHSCDNPPCCNPRHLWVGSQSENIMDCVAKGRHK